MAHCILDLAFNQDGGTRYLSAFYPMTGAFVHETDSETDPHAMWPTQLKVGDTLSIRIWDVSREPSASVSPVGFLAAFFEPSQTILHNPLAAGDNPIAVTAFSRLPPGTSSPAFPHARRGWDVGGEHALLHEGYYTLWARLDVTDDLADERHLRTYVHDPEIYIEKSGG